MVKYFAVRLDEKGNELLGSDNQWFINDLNSVGGVKKRILRAKYAQKGKWNIYRYSSVFDESSYQLVGHIFKRETELKPNGDYYYIGD